MHGYGVIICGKYLKGDFSHGVWDYYFFINHLRRCAGIYWCILKTSFEGTFVEFNINTGDKNPIYDILTTLLRFKRSEN